MGFIDDYRDFILCRVPTNRDWVESVATNVFNTVLGTDVEIHTQIGKLNTNLFFLCIGPSGLAQKTNPLKYYALPTLIGYGQCLDLKPIMPSRFSVEGMIEYLSTKQSRGIIIRDEFSSVFKEKGKSYIADILEFLSELYDGLLQKRYTRKAKLEHTANVCINLLGATTPYIFALMDLSFFVQGTGNRILYIVTQAMTPKKTEMDFFWEKDRYTVDEELEKYIQRLVKFKKSLQEIAPVRTAILATDKLGEFRDKTLSVTKKFYDKDPQGIDHSYMARMGEMAIKLATVHAMSRLEATEEDLSKYAEFPVPVIDEDAEWAISKVKKHVKYFYELKRQWGLASQRLPVMTLESHFDRVVSIMKSFGGECMRTTLLRRCGWSTKKFNEIIFSMIDQKMIRTYVREDYKRKGGPVPRFYKLVS